MAEKPTYEELEQRVTELTKVAVENKRDQEALRDSEERYRQIFSIAPAGIYEVDFRTGKFSNVNEAVCEYTGYTRDELLSMNAIDVLTKDSQDRALSRMAKALNGKDMPDSVDYEIIKKDGSTGWLRINNRYIYDGENIVGSTVAAHNITERKRAEDELEKSELKFRTLVNTAPYGIQLTDWKGKITFSNPAHHAIQGYADGELIGKYIWDLIADNENKTRTKNYYANVIKNQPSPEVFYNRNRTSDGRLVDVQINWDYIRNKTGTPDGIISIVQDITEKKRLEDELLVSEGHLRSLRESATNFAVYRLAIDESSPHKLKVVFVSNSVKEILGIQDSMKFENWFENMHPDDVERIAKANQAALNTMKFNEEYRTYNHKLGEYRWIHAVSTGTVSEGAWTGYVNGIMIDVTEKHKFEDEFLRSQEHIKSLMQSASGFVVYRMVRDDNEPPYNLKMESVSPSVEDVLGYKPEDFEVTSYYDHIHPEDVEGVMEAHKVAFETGKYEKTARVYKPTTGDYVWIHAIWIAVKEKSGEISHVNGIFIDVTEKYTVFEKLKASEKDLGKKNDSLLGMNAALNVLIKKMESNESDFQEQVTANIQHLVLPYLQKIKNNTTDSTKKSLINIVELNLDKITANFTHQLSSCLYSLTSTEIKVANLIKIGNTTKEIAATLNIARKTVESHRERIRKKLGINKKKVNLRSHLLSID